MADLADLDDPLVGELPVRDPPVALQRPYAADPGTLTKWLVERTDRKTPEEVLRTLRATSAKLAAAAANEERHPETALSMLKELAEDVPRRRTVGGIPHGYGAGRGEDNDHCCVEVDEIPARARTGIELVGPSVWFLG